MQEFLASKGIQAIPKYLSAGSLKGCWRLSNPATRWSDELANQLNALGFLNFDGNGGVFCVFVRGHNELLEGRLA